jgi:hypothetical protein
VVSGPGEKHGGQYADCRKTADASEKAHEGKTSEGKVAQVF